MGRIQSNVGLVTGVDIQGTVEQLMKLNAIPRDRLQARITGMQNEQTALTGLMTQIVGVQLTTDRLGQPSLFSSTSVTSGNTQALAARSTGNPKPGSYSFVPVRLAQSQQQTSALLASGKESPAVQFASAIAVASARLSTYVLLRRLPTWSMRSTRMTS